MEMLDGRIIIDVWRLQFQIVSLILQFLGVDILKFFRFRGL